MNKKRTDMKWKGAVNSVLFLPTHLPVIGSFINERLQMHLFLAQISFWEQSPSVAHSVRKYIHVISFLILQTTAFMASRGKRANRLQFQIWIISLFPLFQKLSSIRLYFPQQQSSKSCGLWAAISHMALGFVEKGKNLEYCWRFQWGIFEQYEIGMITYFDG